MNADVTKGMRPARASHELGRSGLRVLARRPLRPNSSEPSHPRRRRRAVPQGPLCHSFPPCLHRKSPHVPRNDRVGEHAQQRLRRWRHGKSPRCGVAQEHTPYRRCRQRRARRRARLGHRDRFCRSAKHATQRLNWSALRIRRQFGIETHAWPSTLFAPASPICPGLPASPAVPSLPGVPGLPSAPFVPFLPSAAGEPRAPAEPGAESPPIVLN